MVHGIGNVLKLPSICAVPAGPMPHTSSLSQSKKIKKSIIQIIWFVLIYILLCFKTDSKKIAASCKR